MSEEMKGTTRYLDATVMEYALLDHARLRTPYGTQDDVRAYAAGGEKAALHDLALALADMASRTGISWTTASDTAPTFRDGGTEAYVELRRDQPNGHYSHLDAEAYLCTADGPRCIARLNLTEPGDIPSTVSGADGLASRIADRLNHPQFPKAGAYGPTAGRMGDCRHRAGRPRAVRRLRCGQHRGCGGSVCAGRAPIRAGELAAHVVQAARDVLVRRR